MLAEFRHFMGRSRGQIIGWGIGLAVYGVLMAGLYSSIAEMEGIQELMDQYPPELMAFFGGAIDIVSPKGYLNTYYFMYMHLIIGIFTIGTGANLLVGDEEKGLLDLIVSHPISRTALFWGRFVGMTATTLIILLVGWLSWLLPSSGSGLDLTWIEFLRPFLPLFAILMFFSTLALMLSMLIPSGRMAGWLSGLVLIGNFLLLGLGAVNEDLKPIMDISPLHFYQGGDAITEVNWEWFLGLLGVSLLFTLVAWWRFQQRDIRVGGEGGWQLPPKLAFWRRGQ